MIKGQFHRIIILFITVIVFSNVNEGQVLINEICPRNSYLFEDEYHKFYDWIELYNIGNDTVDLINWTISDDLTNTNKWSFPGIVIPPDSTLIILASGKDRKIIADHWETLIHAEETWKYWIPDGEPDPGWKDLGFADTSWLEGPGGFGRGDGDDNTILPDSVATVYLRKLFSIYDTSDISLALLHIDNDDAFVAYLNGVEIARARIAWPGKIQAWDDYAWVTHEALMFQGLPPEEFWIDMELFRSLVVEGENVLAIQSLNGWNNHGNSSIIPFLSVCIKSNSFTYQEIPEWFDSPPVCLHTNFSLSGDGENLVLCNQNQVIVDLIEYPFLRSDHSYGRQTDGSPVWKYFAEPTPFSSNISASYSGYTKEPEFDLPQGFYNNGVEVSLCNYLPEDTIRITIDGSIPVDTSEIYTEPVFVDSTLILRGRVFKSNYLPGEIATNSYFIGYSSTLPVVSISMNPHDLWDWEEGIYVLGPNAEPNYPYKGANFWQPWEKASHVEFFDTLQNLGFEQDIGIMIHGGFSRANPMKSLRLIADSKYGKSRIEYKLHQDKNINSFKKMVLRNSGQDYNITHFRDGLMHKLVQEKTSIHTLEYQPVVVFLNGQYWGIHNLREKIDRFYINENTGEPVDSLDLLADNLIVVEGDYYDFAEKLHYIKDLPVIDSAAYDTISKIVDINNFTDYFIAEIFYSNAEWPRHNIKYWRKRHDTFKWRHILNDVDFGFGLYSSAYSNDLHRVLFGNIPWTENHKIFRRLIEYADYRRYFNNRSADIFNTILLSENITDKIYKFKNRLVPEMENHKSRWGGTFSNWETKVENMVQFVQSRQSYVWQHYLDEFVFEKLVTIELDIDSIFHGNVKINTIIPDSLPWQGLYFDGNPVDITAISDSGYMFSHWASNMVITGNDTLNQKLNVNVDTNATFKAFFVIDTIPPDTPMVVFSEICYSSVDSLDADDWIELLNIDTISLNLAGWVFKDGDDDHEFVLPQSTILDTNQYLVLCQDNEKFGDIYPEVENVIGSFDFGLKREGEVLRLFDSTGMQVTFVLYSNQSPWPEDADETGKTLEIIDPFENLNDPANWFAGCYGGSPGGPYIPCDTIGIEKLIRKDSRSVVVYPNPFIESTSIGIYLNQQGNIQFKVFNAFGILVFEKSYYFQKGPNQIDFFKEKLQSGLYFYHLSGKDINNKGKLIIK